MSADLKHAVEAVLFASEKPIPAEQIKEAFPAEGGPASGGDAAISTDQIKAVLEELKNEYETQERGFKLFEVAGGYQLGTDPRFSPYLKRFYLAREKKKLSQASLETLSVIAYKQPVTRADIEFIRGVNVDGALKTLTDRGLVKIVGRKEIPGRPMLYGTTKEFLERMGLNSLKGLPPLPQYTEKDIPESMVPPEMKAAYGASAGEATTETDEAQPVENEESDER